jgi:hypothetical protein
MKRGAIFIKSIKRDSEEFDYIDDSSKTVEHGHQTANKTPGKIQAKIIEYQPKKLTIKADSDEKEYWIIIYTLADTPLKLGCKIKRDDLLHTIKTTVGRPTKEPQFYVSTAVHTG